jgi:hypothetical protein
LIWANSSKKNLEKITHKITNTTVHPFLPLFESDSIKQVDLNITKTFTHQEDKVFFNHVDFNYKVEYLSRFGKENESTYTISTEAVVHAYDYEQLFYEPKYPFADEEFKDYIKIQSMPYNDFFWRFNDEFKVNDSMNANQAFFENPASNKNSKVWLKRDTVALSALFQGEFVPWTEKRIWFKNHIEQQPPTNSEKRAVIIADEFNLSVKLFMDVNRYDDTTNYLTAAIFDCYESFYNLPMDLITQGYVNMFFDLAEIERRKMQYLLESCDGEQETIEKIYRTSIQNLRNTEKNFVKDVDRGNKLSAMKIWNARIKDELGIDNLTRFSSNTE